MKIGILSDTHGSVRAWEAAVNNFFRACGLIIHAGDVLYHGPRNPLPDGYNPQKLAELINGSQVPVVFARGNCDAEIDSVLLRFPVQSPYAVLHLNGKLVLVTHGQDMDAGIMAELAGRYQADLWISGHTHVPVLEKKNSTVFLNPGSCALPKSDEGPTVAVWDDSRISVISLIDGGEIKRINF